MRLNLKNVAREALRRLGVYHRIKASRLYDLYWMVVDRRVIEQRRQEMAFYSDLLQGGGPGDLIFDIGANKGAKTEIFLRLGATVVAVDPDRLNQEILRERFERYRIRPMPLSIVAKAVSATSGVGVYWIQEPGSGMNTLSTKWVETLRVDEARFGRPFRFSERREVGTLTLHDLVQTYGTPKFVKIDVEGHELDVIRGIRSPVECLSFEVNLPEFRAEGKQCVDQLKEVAEHGVFNYAIDCGRGVVLEEWLPGESFQRVLDECREQSIEVFWKTKTA